MTNKGPCQVYIEYIKDLKQRAYAGVCCIHA